MMVTPSTTHRLPGRIVTFYSYKGGTGRSMAVANVAWILASNAKRVLVIDWDFEAPGLHRYFHPFLRDKEFTSSPGLIDFFVEFAAAAGVAHSTPKPNPTDAQTNDWYEPYACLVRYAYSLEWDFPRDGVTGHQGTVDFVPAGQQGPSYALNVTSFDWQSFYEKLGGGIFLEVVKRELRKDYDYILIDSRTGISDTAGICTVQMPDDIVVCFTLNQQSIKGAVAVIESAYAQRLRATGEPSLHVWPVPTRVELGEKERLDTALELACGTFQKYLGHLTREERSIYWERIQVLYQPFFAYEEILAPFADRRGHKASLLASMLTLASYLNRKPIEIPAMPEATRLEGLERFKRRTGTTEGHSGRVALVYLSYHRDDYAVATRLMRAIESAGFQVWWDRSIRLGDNWQSSMESAMQDSSIVIVLISKKTTESTGQRFEINKALSEAKPVIPVLVPGATFDELPVALERLQALELRHDTFDEDISYLTESLEHYATNSANRPLLNPDDPQKGQWGGQSRANGRVLSATVHQLSEDWFEIGLAVRSIEPDQPLLKPVTFFLHPTFGDTRRSVEPKDGQAEIKLTGWGAFTVGVEADNGKTRLELDLAEETSFPEIFRAR